MFAKIRIKSIFFAVIMLTNSCNTDENSDFKNQIHSIENETQTEMNLSAEGNYLIVTAKLDSVYKQIAYEYASNSETTQAIINSQETWILYRDAQLLMKYPETDPLREGSAFNACYFSYLTELTMERLETLNPWSNGAKEGDVCSGSINIK